MQQSPEGLDEAEREGLRRHLESCPPCRDSLAALASFDFEAAAAAGRPRRAAAAAGRSPGSRLKELIAFPDLRAPALAGLTLLALAIPLGFGLWWLDGSGDLEAPLAATGLPEVASQPMGPALEADAPPAPEISAAPAPPPARVPAPPSPVHGSPPPRRLAPAGQAPAAVAAAEPAAAPALETEPAPGEPALAESAPDPGSVLLAMASLDPPGYLAPPLLSGLVGSRIQEISRAGGVRLPQLQALAPDHPGRSLRESPTLYWFISAPTPLELRFSLIHPTAIDPVLELSLGPVARAGIAGLKLEERGVQLEPGIRYRWFVSLSRDARGGGSDLLSGGEIERIEPDEELRSGVADAPSAALGHRYAERGLWYDSFDFFSGWVERDHRHAAPRLARAALLEQVGLGEAAAHERRIAEAGGSPLPD
jgi:hypothetical protein